MNETTKPAPAPVAGSETAQQILDRLRSPEGLSPDEARLFVTLLHRLDRIRLAEVSGYALGLATLPRHTVIPPGHYLFQKPNTKRSGGGQ